MGINTKRLINVLGSRLREKFQEENVMKVRKILVVLAATFLIAAAAVRPSFAQCTGGSCSDASISGIYQCTGTGFAVPVVAGSFIPYTFQGNLFFNGSGAFTITDTLFEWSFNVLGFPFAQAVFVPTGSGYIVGPDGEGSATIDWAQTILSATFGFLIFQSYSLGINTVNSSGVAQQITLAALPTIGTGSGSPQFPNTGILVCNHQ